MTAAVLTVTLNPALDVAARTSKVLPYAKLRCDDVRYSPGGGGVNVARVLRRLGRSVYALYAGGGPVGEQIGRLLDAEGVQSESVRIAGETRSNLAVTEASTGNEFRFVLPGPTMSSDEWIRIRDRVEALCPESGHLVASGSLPAGAPDDAYAELARIAKRRACRFILDTSGPALMRALNAGVHTIKPSRGEFLAATGTGDLDAALSVGRAWLAEGKVERIVVSLGADGARLLTDSGALSCTGTPRKIVTSLGAGDALVAGLVEADIRRLQPGPALKFATAVASCAVARERYEGVNFAEIEAALSTRNLERK